MPTSTSIGVTTLLVLRIAATARSILGNSGSQRNVATVGLRDRVIPVDPVIGYASPMAAHTYIVCTSSHCGRQQLHEQPQGSLERTPVRSPAGVHLYGEPLSSPVLLFLSPFPQLI